MKLFKIIPVVIIASIALSGCSIPFLSSDTEGSAKTAQQDTTVAPDVPPRQSTSDSSAIELIQDQSELSSFYEFIQAAGLSEQVESFGGTILAPSDAAFSALSDEVRAQITQEPQQILQYHLIDEQLSSIELMQSNSVTSRAGERMNIVLTNESLLIEDAIVVRPDLESRSAIVHVIDAVLRPELFEDEELEEATESAEVERQSEATSAAEKAESATRSAER